MVVSKTKFMCDMGVAEIFYCKICGTPHLDRKDAERCEKAHSIAAQPSTSAPLL